MVPAPEQDKTENVFSGLHEPGTRQYGPTRARHGPGPKPTWPATNLARHRFSPTRTRRCTFRRVLWAEDGSVRTPQRQRTLDSPPLIHSSD
jgi:hypothetical protein